MVVMPMAQDDARRLKSDAKNVRVMNSRKTLTDVEEKLLLFRLQQDGQSVLSKQSFGVDDVIGK